MEAVFGSIFDQIVMCLCAPIGRQFSHLKSLKENVKTLSQKMGELSAEEFDVKERLRTGKVNQAKLPNKVVELWLEKVETISRDQQKINNEVTENKKCLNGCLPDYLKRIKLSKLAKKKTQEVVDLLQDRRNWNAMFADPTPIGLVIPTVDLVGKTTAEMTLERIWESLKDPEKGIIGVYGMGGAGKTTILKHINNRFLEGKQHINSRFVEEGKVFDIIIWATVSKDFNLKKLQNDIATILKINVSIYQDDTTRAAKLSESLKASKFLLILDDVWAEFSLEKVGIPPPSRENGCKLILTTRSREVCVRMDCAAIEVKSLSEGEAWELFKKYVGNNVKFTENVEKYARLVARECACLPLAIVTVGSAMKQKVALEVWRNALRELKNLKAKYMNEQVLAHLKFSFDCLSNKMVQECFLYCALYPEDHKIPCKELVDHWIAEGLMDDDKDWEAERDKGYVVLEELKNSCMLENVEGGKHVKMHDLIRDMAINITSQNNRFIVNAGVGLTGSLEKEKWTEGVERISLMNNSIDALPDQPNCPKLSTLLLQGNPLLRNISDSFFKQLHNLRVLNLSYIGIMYLPESFSSLTELRVLNVSRSEIEAMPQGIEGAVNLTDIDLSYTKIKTLPSLSRLTELRQLNLEGSSIKAVPEGLKGAVNLRYINLKNIRTLQLFPAGILPNLTRLEELLLKRSGWKWRKSSNGGGAGIEDIISLSHLGCLEIHFEDWQGWTPYFTSDKWKSLKRFSFNIGDVEDSSTGSDNKIKIRGCDIVNQERSGMFPDNTENLYMEDCICRVSLFSNLKDLKELVIKRCHEMKTIFPLGLFQHLSNLRRIEVTECKEIEEIATGEEGEIIAEASNSAITLLPQLQLLSLEDLPKLRRVCKRELVCESLGCITVRNCPLLKNLPFSVDNILPSLLLIEVRNCEEIEEIAGGEAGEEGEIIAEASNSAITLLPQLHSLTLENLPKLRRVCKRELVCESLSYIIVTNCPLLKKLPFSVDNISPSLRVIDISNCEEIEEIAAGEEGDIIAEASNSAITLLPQLQYLFLIDLPELRRVCKRELVCESLRRIKVRNCPLLKKLPFSMDNITPDLLFIEVENCPLLKKLPFSVDNILPSLLLIEVRNCEEIEEIAGGEAGEEGEIIAEASNSAITLFPQLQYLYLIDLPKLGRVCKRELVCESLTYIEVWNCPLLKKLPFFVDNIPPSLKKITVSNCEEIEEIAAGEEGEIIAEASNSTITLLPQLHTLTLEDLPKLRRVCKRELVCKSLESIIVRNCPLLKKLPFSVDNILPSLWLIEVRNCEEIEEIAGGEAGEEGEIIAEASNSAITLLPQLQYLKLTDLPKLGRVCKRELVCESLENIVVKNCPLLKKLPFSVDNILPSLEKIYGEKEWWDALEWDDPNTKVLLQPFFQAGLVETEEEEETEEEILEDERREADKEE